MKQLHVIKVHTNTEVEKEMDGLDMMWWTIQVKILFLALYVMG